MAQVWPIQMPPVAKSVLVSLADNSNDSGYCWPSIETICERTCFKRRAVIDAIHWLEQNKYLTPDRSNGRKTTYQLTVKTGINSSAEMLKTSAPNAPVQETHQCATRANQCTTRTKPVRQTHTNRQEPSRTVIKSLISELPECIPVEVWQMWHEYRFKKSGKGWTEYAQKLAVRSMTKIAQAGHDLRTAVETSIERGYSGIFEPKVNYANHSSASRNSDGIAGQILANHRASQAVPADG
jgi:hypothetical protein